MGDYVTLLGAEDVRRAASEIAHAAAEMQRAANWIAEALAQHERFMDDWLARLVGAMSARGTDHA